MAHVRRQQVGVEQEGGGGDQVVGIVDTAVGGAVALGKRAGGSGYLLPHRHPGNRREELLQRIDLLLAHACEQLEANYLAGKEGFLCFEQPA